jgi:hypothetical protein
MNSLSEGPLPELVVKRAHGPEQDDQYLRKFLSSADIDVTVDKTTRIVREDGTTLAILLRGAMHPLEMLPMYRAIRTKIGNSDNRGDASGEKAIRKVKSDGTISSTQRTANPCKSSLLGFFDRYPRFPYCRQTAFNEKHPALFVACLPAIRRADWHFQMHMPERWAEQKARAEKTSPDFLIPGTVFTTVTLNKNFRTACHRDAGDLKAGFGCMTYMRSGKFDGGHLAFPAYRTAIKMDSGDLVLFDPHEVHGNTEIRPLTKDWERITCVHYYREKMYFCGDAKAELERAKQFGAKGVGTMNINWREGVNETDAPA